MTKTEKGFIVKLPCHLHQRLKIASSVSNMTMQHITMNAIQRELGIFDATVKLYNNSLHNLPGLNEYKKMHIDLAKKVDEEDDLNVMEKKMEEAILNKNTEQVCYEGHHINKEEEDSHEFFNSELINTSKTEDNDTPNDINL